ncbi:MAG TPA: hypothetical protein VKD26_06060, partial [Streptosporangiaceae bacterium]|nr:hypothetical protein [Streptosporangiaceae bacterium]
MSWPGWSRRTTCLPTSGEEIGRVLTRRMAEGRYAGAADEASLAPLVTKDLQAVNGDRHLRLLHRADEVPASGDDAAEMAALARHAGLNCGGIARVERSAGRRRAPRRVPRRVPA